MNNVIAINQEDIEKYREKIFKSKEECRKIFAKEPFERKIRIAFELYKRAEYFKKFKQYKKQ
jgi:hypothetical protein